ncbi:hypothetical protein [Thermotalea metallivorans]|uniref:Uncharacterized protein n=1 Tax=Thermotalea metallivorans TaxID=520762 RepID=A0A140L2Z6_9FIRM|nr:hypothetical protein [Thermotalea metallivorans]KXG74921.1 hypothetical protein AN619_20200 [Thermotalea metallivorans]
MEIVHEKKDRDISYKTYMNEECDETFIDMKEEVGVMDEAEARELF